jgi:hypothetical protein
LRHAYAQVESSEAMVTSARGTGQLPPEVAELHDLRREVQQLRRDQLETVGRMRDAERHSAELQSELAAAANGNGGAPATPASDDGEGSEIAEGESSAAARSLRSRLAQTAARKKGDKSEPDSGFGV